MIDSEKLGDVFIVERCYIRIGTKPESHSLLFGSLQQLIDMDRKVSVIFAIFYWQSINLSRRFQESESMHTEK